MAQITLKSLHVSYTTLNKSVESVKTTVNELAISVEKLTLAVAKGFTAIDERFEEVRSDISLLKMGQEDIIMRLDNKVNKIDLPYFKKKLKD